MDCLQALTHMGLGHGALSSICQCRGGGTIRVVMVLSTRCAELRRVVLGMLRSHVMQALGGLGLCYDALGTPQGGRRAGHASARA